MRDRQGRIEGCGSPTTPLRTPPTSTSPASGSPAARQHPRHPARRRPGVHRPGLERRPPRRHRDPRRQQPPSPRPPRRSGNPQLITAPLDREEPFGLGGFFDPADLVQVKYEMVRKAEAAGVPASRAAADFGFSRQSLYSARAALRERAGRPGFRPSPGPRAATSSPARSWTCWRTCWQPTPACGRRTWPPRSGSVSASASIRVRSNGRCSAAARPGPRTGRAASRFPGRHPKAPDQSGPVRQVIPAGDDRGALARRYEELRSAAAAGSGGWRHGLGVLLGQGMAAWMAAWASLPAARAGPGAEPGRSAAAAPHGASLSASTQSQPAPSSKGGDASSPACTSLPPALSSRATSEIIAVLAQMTLAHARPVTRPGGRSP